MRQIVVFTIVFLIVVMAVVFLVTELSKQKETEIDIAIYHENYRKQQEIDFWEVSFIILLEDLEKDLDNAEEYIILAIAKSESNRRGLFGREREKFLGREGLYFAERILSEIQQKHKWEE